MMRKIVLIVVIPLFFISCFASQTLEKTSSAKKDLIKMQSFSEKNRYEARVPSEKKARNISKQASNKSENNSTPSQNEEIEITNSEGNLICYSSQGDEFSPGYVQVGNKCDPNETLCLGFNSTFRNFCKEGKKILVKYSCDPKTEDFVFSKEIQCEKACRSGACIR